MKGREGEGREKGREGRGGEEERKGGEGKGGRREGQKFTSYPCSQHNTDLTL